MRADLPAAGLCGSADRHPRPNSRPGPRRQIRVESESAGSFRITTCHDADALGIRPLDGFRSFSEMSSEKSRLTQGGVLFETNGLGWSRRSITVMMKDLNRYVTILGSAVPGT